MRSKRFDGTYDGFLLRKTDDLVKEISARHLGAAQVHSHLDRSEAIRLLSDLLEMPSADSSVDYQ
jgi:hypothetical protein